MLRLIAGFFCLFEVVFLPVYAVDSAPLTRHYIFTDKAKAEGFYSRQQEINQNVNLTTQKKPVQVFLVLLKGYTQWSSAFKQAQLLEKNNIHDVEVVKGRFERGYSILVSQFTDKKKAGQLFNKLRKMGFKNVRVTADKINGYQYIVTIHNSRKRLPKNHAQKIKSLDAKKSFRDKSVINKSLPVSAVSKSDTGKKTPVDKQEKQSEEEITIVMSGNNSDFDVNYEIPLEDGVESYSSTTWGSSFNLEEDLFTRKAQDANHSDYANAKAYIEHSINDNWELKLSARLDVNHQSGRNGTDYSDADFDYGDSYLRYRDESWRVTLGTQTIRWGKVDHLGPLDNMATLDLSRGVTLKWGENYRSSPAVRAEYFHEKSKFELVYLADFRAAELADKDDVWYPINFRKGRMLGFKYNPGMASLIQNARIDDDYSGDGGWGMRYSTTLNSYDIGLTVQKIRLSAPYYKLNEAIRQKLLAGQMVNPASYSYTFSEEHPRSWVVGGDAELQWKQVTWRMEAGWFSDLPATAKTLKYETYDGFKWAGSAEFYPGDADTRVNLQLSGQHLNEKEKILDLDNVIVLSGEVESLFSNSRWRASGKFNIGLNNKEFILSPEIAYLGWEPFEIYTAVHYLDGDDDTLGGFYKNNTMLTIGWRGQF